LFKLKIRIITSSAIKKQVDSSLPLLSSKQQSLVLEMIKTFLTKDNSSKRITRKQYNKEIEEAVKRIDKRVSVSHSDALNELSKWKNLVVIKLFGTDLRLTTSRKFYIS
jgi:hypothetical protein